MFIVLSHRYLLRRDDQRNYVFACPSTLLSAVTLSSDLSKLTTLICIIMDRVRNLVTAVLAFFSFTVPSIFWISYFCFPAATKQVIHHEDLTTNVGGYSSSLASSRSIGDYRYPLKTDFKWTSSRNATAITKSLLKRDPVYDKVCNYIELNIDHFRC